MNLNLFIMSAKTLSLETDICRCCLLEGSFKDLAQPYIYYGKEEVYYDMLKDVFNIEVRPVPGELCGVTYKICETCIQKLRDAFHFREQVISSEIKFKEMYERSVSEVKSLGLNSFIKQEDTGSISIEIKCDIPSMNSFCDGHSIRVEDETNNPTEVFVNKFEDLEDDIDSKFNDEDESIAELKAKKETEGKKKSSPESKQKGKRTKKAKEEDSDKTGQAEGSTSKKKKGVTRVSDEPKGKTLKKVKGLTKKVSENDVPEARNRGSEELEKHRTNIREILLNSNATPIRCRGGIGYACCFCKDQYPDPADLKRHTDTHDVDDKQNFMKGRDMYGYLVKLDITKLSCKICNENMDTFEDLLKHLKDEHDKNVFTDIKHQILPFKFDSETLRCFICTNVFNRFKSLQEHVNVHYRNYNCDVCDAGFVNRHVLLVHRECHKTGTFACEGCPKVFNTLRKKKLHVRSAHSSVNLPHKCGYCDERFKENFRKIEHLAKVHGVRGPTVKCQECEKTFETHRAWLDHTKRDHLKQRPYKCSHCEMDFYSKKQLDCHEAKHTGLREFQCKVCFKSYGRIKTLREHVRRLHADDRYIKCQHCGLSFIQNTSLKSHMLLKHGAAV